MLPDHVVLKKSKRARRLALRLDPVERVFHLVVPSYTSMRTVQRFAEEHEGWMTSRLMALPPRVVFEHGAVVPVFGSRRRICITVDESFKRTQIELMHNQLRVKTNKDDPQGRIVRFLKGVAKDELLQLSKDKAKHIHKRVRGVSVRDTKSRWGSCSPDGHLSFSWRLIFAPPEAFDYVVAHEVAHLRHLDHSKAFWGVCRGLSDNFIEGQYWMREHRHELMRYG